LGDHSIPLLCVQLEKLEQMLPMSEEGGTAAAAEGSSEKDEAAMAARAQEQQMVSLIWTAHIAEG